MAMMNVVTIGIYRLIYWLRLIGFVQRLTRAIKSSALSCRLDLDDIMDENSK